MSLLKWNKLQALVAKEIAKIKRMKSSDLFLDTDFPVIFAKTVDRNSDVNMNIKNIKMIAFKLLKLI